MRFASILAISIFLVVAGGAEAQDNSASTPENLTSITAIQTALTTGIEAQRAALELERQLIEVKRLEWMHFDGPPPGPSIPGLGSIGGPSDYERAQVNHLLPVQAEALRESATKAYLQRTAAVQSDVIAAFYQAVLARDSVDVHRGAHQRMQSQLQQLEAMFAQGTIAEIDLLQMRASAEQSAGDLQTAEEQADLALLQLKQLIGLDPTAQVDLIGVLDPLPRQALDFNADLEQALAASAELAGAQGQLAIAEKDLSLYEQHHRTSANHLGHREKVIAVEEARLAAIEARHNIEVGLRALYVQLNDAERRVETADNQLQLAQRLQHIAQARYESGLATITEVLEAETGLRNAELARLQAVADHHIAAAQLDALLGKGLPVRTAHLQEVQQRVESMYR